MFPLCLKAAASDDVSPISQLLSKFNAVDINVRGHMSLFRIMQSIERVMKQMKACVGKRHFLRHFQFVGGFLMISSFQVKTPTGMFLINPACAVLNMDKTV